MENKDRIKLEMRLQALEEMVAKQYAMMAFQAGMTEKDLSDALEVSVRGAGETLFPIPDPALSDWASAEWEDANRRLASRSTQMLGALMAKRPDTKK